MAFAIISRPSKQMQLKRREIQVGLKKLGRIEPGTKHEKCRVIIDGKKIGTVSIPSNYDYDDTLIGFVAKPLGLNNQLFSEICGCSKDGSWYRNYLIEQGKL